MITTLSIKNYALIEDVKVDFSTKLTIITGETGAGKSILLGALALLLGKRADLSAVKNTDKKCIIEGEFSLQKHKQLPSVFQSLDVDYDDQTIIRREILPGGKSRSFVNDTPVNLQQLQGIAPYLVDIHSQNETMTLSSENYQMDIVDAIAGNEVLLKSYTTTLREYKKTCEELETLQAQKEAVVKEIDYNTFLYQELQQANLKNTKLTELEETYNTLSNSELIDETLQLLVQQSLDENVGSAELLKQMRAALGKIKTFSSQFESLWDRLNALVIEFEDITDEIERASQHTQADPQLLFEINEKLQRIYTLQQKHNVTTLEELLQIEEKLALKIDETGLLDETLQQLQAKKEAYVAELDNISAQIHKKRKGCIPTLTKKLQQVLNELGMPHAFFDFQFSPAAVYKNNGKDNLQLLFTANKGATPGLLKKVASGGEMSRIMLAIKAVLASYKQLPTIIFDEIDTGVSGEVATKMATILHTMSAAIQLVSITHLPQIASKGMHHLKVFKKDVKGYTETFIETLSQEQRVHEIAQMIGGKSLTESALIHAKQLLN